MILDTIETVNSLMFFFCFFFAFLTLTKDISITNLSVSLRQKWLSAFTALANSILNSTELRYK